MYYIVCPSKVIISGLTLDQMKQISFKRSFVVSCWIVEIRKTFNEIVYTFHTEINERVPNNNADDDGV